MKKEGTYHCRLDSGKMMFYLQFKAKETNSNIPTKKFSTIFSPPIPNQKRLIYFIKDINSIMNSVVNKCSWGLELDDFYGPFQSYPFYDYMLQVLCFYFKHILQEYSQECSLWLYSTHF